MQFTINQFLGKLTVCREFFSTFIWRKVFFHFLLVGFNKSGRKAVGERADALVMATLAFWQFVNYILIGGGYKQPYHVLYVFILITN